MTETAPLRFPEGFRWGVATAAHQVEGGNSNNNWWAWEEQPGRIRQGQRSGQACDWWEDAEPDLDRAAEMGLNALRLSVEWSRIEPSPGEFDEWSLERYARLLQALHQRGIEPMVTLHHFSDPLWLHKRRGWENPETIDLFSRFVGRTLEALAPYCTLWCTINEPNVYASNGYLEGVFPPGKCDLRAALRVIRHMMAGHAAAYRAIHALQPQARVGFAHNMRIFDPANASSPLDRAIARFADRAFNQAILIALTEGRWTLPLGMGPASDLQNTLDWIGLNYYTRDLVAFDLGKPGEFFQRRFHADDAELLDGGYGEFYPLGMYRCLQDLTDLDIPIYVTENGIPDHDDDQRPRYLLTHLYQMWRTLQSGTPVIGYYHWTLVDNFEWAEGWTLRFGLFDLDPASQVRTARQSARLFADIVQKNAITPQIIESYAPGLSLERLGAAAKVPSASD